MVVLWLWHGYISVISYFPDTIRLLRFGLNIPLTLPRVSQSFAGTSPHIQNHTPSISVTFTIFPFVQCSKTADKRQVSSSSLNGALQTILKHFKQQGETVERKLSKYTLSMVIVAFHEIIFHQKSIGYNWLRWWHYQCKISYLCWF